jgi:hypothetical protein
MCVSSLTYSARKAHAPCFIVICGFSDSYRIFLHYAINGTILGGKNVIERKMCVLMFSTISV